MPHISILTVPGHSETEKRQLAEEIAALTTEKLHVDLDMVSVSFQEIPNAEWRDHMKQFCTDTIYIKPPYLEELL